MTARYVRHVKCHKGPLTSLTNSASPKQKRRFLKYMFENAATWFKSFAGKPKD